MKMVLVASLAMSDSLVTSSESESLGPHILGGLPIPCGLQTLHSPKTLQCVCVCVCVCVFVCRL